MNPAFLADENFNGILLAALRKRRPSLDVIRAQDMGLSGMVDPDLLEWAAARNRILLTHDVRTMTAYAVARIQSQSPMPGVLEVGRGLSIGQAVEQILLLVDCSLDGDWENQIRYLPM